VRFATYTNYPSFVTRAEIRIFAADRSTQQTPLAVIPVTAGRWADWVMPPVDKPLLQLTSSLDQPRHVQYLLRVYDRDGRFDETRARRLDILTSASEMPAADRDSERLAYGENTLVLHNIPTRGGSITVSGKSVPCRAHPSRWMTREASSRGSSCPAARSR